MISKLIAKLIIFFIKFYQNFVSPFFPPTCRFTPTCSQYAIEAIQKYGFGYGSLLAFKRVVRCHPFSKGGYDPIP